MQAAEAAGHTGVAAAKRAATSLTKAALDRGTRDNVTVLVVDLRAKGSSHHSSSTSSSSAAPAMPAAAAGGAAPAGLHQDKSSSSSSNHHHDKDRKADRAKHHAVADAEGPVVVAVGQVPAATVGAADGNHQQQQQHVSSVAVGVPQTAAAAESPAASLL